MNADWNGRIRNIHRLPGKMMVAITGGGSEAIAAILSTPGASQTILEVRVPYDRDALLRFLGTIPEQFCAEQTARDMAMTAFRQAVQGSPKQEVPLFGVALTASLATDRPKKGDHRVHFAIQSESETWTLTQVFDKSSRDRESEEQEITKLFILLVESALENQRQPQPYRSDPEPVCVPAACVHAVRGLAIQGLSCQTWDQPWEKDLPLRSGEKRTLCVTRASREWSQLLFPEKVTTRLPRPLFCRSDGSFDSEMSRENQVLFPGSFHPVHRGHLHMVAEARTLLNRPVSFELSVTNMDKPILNFQEIGQRLRDLLDRPDSPSVWVTHWPLFQSKVRYFRNATLLVGTDTLVRIADPRYYSPSRHACSDSRRKRDSAIRTFERFGARFLVFSRRMNGTVRPLSEWGLPPALPPLCQEVVSDAFPDDISSTMLRHSSSDPKSPLSP